ncbi:hypothetical protein CITRIK5_70585 [Citricoccus sp. K5]|nr:hypothetical protein CITRIK5_70585 [Citricoccus sp. K5]
MAASLGSLWSLPSTDWTLMGEWQGWLRLLVPAEGTTVRTALTGPRHAGRHPRPGVRLSPRTPTWSMPGTASSS